MILKKLKEQFSILKFNSTEDIPSWALSGPYFFISKTDEELSIVCPSNLVPKGVSDIEPHWSCLKVQGPLDFSLTGILASIASPLAKEKISLFAVSTFNTDYILVKTDKLEQAVQALSQSGFQIK